MTKTAARRRKQSTILADRLFKIDEDACLVGQTFLSAVRRYKIRGRQECLPHQSTTRPSLIPK